MQDTLFTYKLYKKEFCLQVIPTNYFYTRFYNNTKNPILIFNHINIDSSIILICHLSDTLVSNDAGYELIQFYVNNIGKCINFEYIIRQYSYWTFNFKITNSQLLIELL